MYLQTATEDHIRCLLCEEPDQNADEATVDELLVKWKREKYVPKKLKGL